MRPAWYGLESVTGDGLQPAASRQVLDGGDAALHLGSPPPCACARRRRCQRLLGRLEREPGRGLFAGAAAAARAADLDARASAPGIRSRIPGCARRHGWRPRYRSAARFFCPAGIPAAASWLSLPSVRGIDRFEHRDVEGADDVARGIEAGVEEDRAEQSLRACRPGSRAAGSRPIFSLALAQAQECDSLELLGDFVQRLLLDQVGAQARQVAFVEASEAFVQHRGDDAVQDRVAQEFEPFVVQALWLRCVKACSSSWRCVKRITEARLQAL